VQKYSRNFDGRISYENALLEYVLWRYLNVFPFYSILNIYNSVTDSTHLLPETDIYLGLRSRNLE
jgi:hypothetical protein